MDDFIDGFRKFRDTYHRARREEFRALGERGQSPRAMVVACADSRVDPQLMFGARPGEAFIVRNVANLVPPFAPDERHHGTSAALEFAVLSLAVPHIIVLGHSRCGGIAALLDRPAETGGGFIATWMDLARPARERALATAPRRPEDAQRLCEYEAIRLSLANLATFPWIRDRVEAGALRLHGWHFDIAAGTLTRVDDAGVTRLA